jgi:hypothetical protein
VLVPLWGLGAIVGAVVGTSLPSEWRLLVRVLVGGLGWPAFQIVLGSVLFRLQRR